MTGSARGARGSGPAGPDPPRPGFARWLLGHVEELIGGAAFVGMTAIVFVNVVSRYVFNDPIPGADELATLCFTWAVFVGAAAGVRQRLHIGIEFAVARFPPRGRAALGLLVVLLMAFFAALVGAYGWKLMLSGHFKLTPVLQLSYAWVYLAIPVGAALMLLRLGPIAAEHLARLRGPTGPERRAEAAPLA
jgi:TRAP-type C4-dicarboxylate transport system permease small subunit